jgi:hypothetical protein
MYNQDTEVLFPLRVIPTLGGAHGAEWRKLVEHVQSADCRPEEQAAFVLMMVRACGCVGCNADSFRAMRGCTLCAKQNVKRNKGGDREMVENYRQVLNEVDAYIARNTAEKGE